MYSKTKDSVPSETVFKIRNILHKLGLIVAEYWGDNKNPASGVINSVRLNIFGLKKFGTNGKGTSWEYALASAYGELIERIQCRMLLRRFRSEQTNSFSFAPDEKPVKLDELLNSDNNFVQNYLTKFYNGIYEGFDSVKFMTPKDCIDFHIKYFYDSSIPTEIMLPFYNVKDNRVEDIPYSMTFLFQGSNGMSAGNTSQEALVQGLSECFERYVQHQLVLKELTPPDIPSEIYLQDSGIKSLIDYYSKRNYEVSIKDCSLGKNFPVVAAIIVNKETKQYLISFGSHPSLLVAIERTLTEALQGKNLEFGKSFTYLNSLSFSDFLKPNVYENADNMASNGAFSLYPKLFAKKTDWEFDSMTWRLGSESNSDFLRKMIEIAKKSFSAVYVRDWGFLGFPAYSVIIPEATGLLIDYKTFKYKYYLQDFKYYVDKFKTNDGINEIKDIAISFEKIYSIRKDSLIKGVMNFDIIIAAYIRLNEFSQLSEFIRGMKSLSKIPDTYSQNEIDCILLYSDLKSKNTDDDVILNTVDFFYTEGESFKLKNCFLSQNILESLKKNSETSYSKKIANLEGVENMLDSLRKLEIAETNIEEAYKANIINQNNLADILN